MSLEDDIFACFDGKPTITPESIQALVALIHTREKQWVAQVGRLKIDLHFSFLAREEDREEQARERIDLQDQTEELQRQVWELESRLASYVPVDDKEKSDE